MLVTFSSSGAAFSSSQIAAMIMAAVSSLMPGGSGAGLAMDLLSAVEFLDSMIFEKAMTTSASATSVPMTTQSPITDRIRVSGTVMDVLVHI